MREYESERVSEWVCVWGGGGLCRLSLGARALEVWASRALHGINSRSTSALSCAGPRADCPPYHRTHEHGTEQVALRHGWVPVLTLRWMLFVGAVVCVCVHWILWAKGKMHLLYVCKIGTWIIGLFGYRFIFNCCKCMHVISCAHAFIVSWSDVVKTEHLSGTKLIVDVNCNEAHAIICPFRLAVTNCVRIHPFALENNERAQCVGGVYIISWGNKLELFQAQSDAMCCFLKTIKHSLWSLFSFEDRMETVIWYESTGKSMHK